MPTSLHEPRTLTYRFHEFRPSDRNALREVLGAAGGEGAFIDALKIYLQKWAAADWLTEYDLERIARWTARHFPNVAGAVESMAESELSRAQSEQARRTYRVMLGSVRRELAAA